MRHQVVGVTVESQAGSLVAMFNESTHCSGPTECEPSWFVVNDLTGTLAVI